MSRHNSPNRWLLAAALTVGTLTFPAASVAHAQTQHLVFTSNNQVDTWDPILASFADSNWPTTVCKPTPAVGLNAAWQNPHKAFSFGFNAHPWQPGAGLSADWINARNTLSSIGPNGHNWTKYSTPVSGNGEFVLNLLADNCSWIYVDDRLVGFQEARSTPRTYPVTLSGDHTLTFIIFDGGGLAGGMYRLETNTGTDFPDTDEDGLTDAEEFLHGTNKNDPDSDDDGASDGAEVAAGTNPLVFNVPADNTPPVITPLVSGALNGGWYTSDVAVTWTVTDPETAVTSPACAATTVTTDTAGTTFTCTATSGGGTSTESVIVRRDTTPPTGSPSVSGTEFGGWYTSNVTIAWSVSETLSPVTASGCTPTTVTTDTTGTTFTCSATSAGGTTSQTVTIRRDTTAPAIASVTNNAPALWPPNHKMHAITVTVNASDAGVGGAVCRIEGVSSNEGGNQHEPDVEITGPLTVNLRAERDGNVPARVYTIQVSCKDSLRNTSAGTTVVTVPHDQGKKK